VAFLVVGEALVDVVARPDGTSERHPGGSPANVAVGLGRLGHDVALLTAFGDDADGRLLRSHLEDSRVRVLAAPTGRTGVAQATLDDDGVATYAFDLSWDLGGAPTEAPPTWLHVGSLGTWMTPGAAAVRDLVDRYAGRATVSYDPNCRPHLMGDAGAARTSVEALVAASDVVKASEEDVAWLYPGTSAVDVARAWAETGPALVVVTLGAEGAVGVAAGAVVEVGPAAGGPVVDTVGAGDAFSAGLLSALAGVDLARLDAGTATGALERGALVARRTCEREGADPPWGLPPRPDANHG
jgi:fructokinase